VRACVLGAKASLQAAALRDLPSMRAGCGAAPQSEHAMQAGRRRPRVCANFVVVRV